MKVRINTEKVKVAMIKKGMNGKKLAEKTGISILTVYGIINDIRDVRLSNYVKLCHALGVSLDEFIEVEND